MFLVNESPNHSKQQVSTCGLSLDQSATEHRKNLEKKSIFQIGALYPHGIAEVFPFK